MNQRVINGSPAFGAALIFLIAEGIKMAEIVPSQQWKNFEVMVNAIMLLLAVVSFFVQELPLFKNSTENWERILANVAISVIAFPMNIHVFEHSIRQDYLLVDLKGWHCWWIFCAMIQVLVLTELGKKLLDLVGTFWGCGKSVGGYFKSIAADYAEAFRHCNKITVWILMLGFLFLGVYWRAQVHIRGLENFFSDMEILWGSVLIWTAYMILALLTSIVLKARRPTEPEKGTTIKKMLFTVLAVVVGALLAFLKAIAIFGLLPIVLIGLHWFAEKTIEKRIKNKENVQGQIKNREKENSENAAIRLKDLNIVLTAFIWLPLLIIYFRTFFLFLNNGISDGQDLTNLTAWLGFVDQAFSIAKQWMEMLAYMA